MDSSREGGKLKSEFFLMYYEKYRKADRRYNILLVVRLLLGLVLFFCVVIWVGARFIVPLENYGLELICYLVLLPLDFLLVIAVTCPITFPFRSPVNVDINRAKLVAKSCGQTTGWGEDLRKWKCLLGALLFDVSAYPRKKQPDIWNARLEEVLGEGQEKREEIVKRVMNGSGIQ